MEYRYGSHKVFNIEYHFVCLSNIILNQAPMQI
jgi:hypothetical protein